MKSEICRKLLVEAGALSLRDVPKHLTNEEVETLPLNNQPFLYSSGNWGPGYVMIKSQVVRRGLMDMMCAWLAVRIAEEYPVVEFVAGNATGGMVPAWIVAGQLTLLLDREVRYVYVRDTRKKGGHKELVTGFDGLQVGMKGIVMEELVNFAQTTCNSAIILRDVGMEVERVATILSYENPKAIDSLRENEVKMTSLITLFELLGVASDIGAYSPELIADYMRFLEAPQQWQADRGLMRVEQGGTK